MFSCYLCGLVVPLFCSPCQDWKFLYFFQFEIFQRFSGESHFFGRPFLCFLLVFKGFQFVPSRGSPVRASDHVRTGQESLKVEHVKTSLLSSSLAIFQQF